MESGDGNAKRGCGRWMEDCGRGAAVEQLTARGMEEYQSPQWGAIAFSCGHEGEVNLSIPAMGGNRRLKPLNSPQGCINPRDGGQ